MTDLTKSDFAALDAKVNERVDIQVDKMRRRGDNGSSHWSLDRKIPIALILTVVGQFVWFIWMGASFKAETQGQLDLIKADNAVIHAAMAMDGDNLKDTIISMRAQFDKLDAKLDRILDRK
jgi:hypothetical protein